MKKMRFLALAGVLALAGTGCADLEVTNLNDPDRERAITTAGDVEALIAGSFSSWWSGNHYNGPGPALSVAADDHTSSWGNFGMRDMGWEPRKAYDNDPSYSYSYVNEAPWGDLYQALSGVRDGLIAIEGLAGGEPIEIGTGGEDTHRARAFGKLVQGLSLGTLAQVFDRAFIVFEDTDLEAATLQPYDEVHAAAQQKLDEAIALANQQSFTVPSSWVGDNGAWSSEYFAQFAHSMKARFMASVPRTVAEREAVNWQTVMSEAQQGITEEFATFYDGSNWGWDRLKVHAGSRPIWARVDLRHLGVSDAAGEYQAWEAISNPEQRLPFDIDTDDRRVTGAAGPTSDGLYHEHGGPSPFRPERGTYHFSPYRDLRWRHLSDAGYIGIHPDLPPKELEFLMAEAMLRPGPQNNPAGAMAIVNKYRTMNGELPAFEDPNGVAPGGDRCVPKTIDGSCGDLFEALKWEKRVEVWHYGMGTAYFDDRGWGDLVTNTALQLPVPGSELLLLLEQIYTFGGPGGDGAAPSIVHRFDPEALRLKREAHEAYRAARQAELEPGVVH